MKLIQSLLLSASLLGTALAADNKLVDLVYKTPGMSKRDAHGHLIKKDVQCKDASQCQGLVVTGGDLADCYNSARHDYYCGDDSYCYLIVRGVEDFCECAIKETYGVQKKMIDTCIRGNVPDQTAYCVWACNGQGLASTETGNGNCNAETDPCLSG